MPHCVIECPSELNELVCFDTLVKAVHDAAESTGLFSVGDVKSRLVTSNHYMVGGKKENYVHVITHILSGRSTEQKKHLSELIARTLCELLPGVEMLSVEVQDIDKQCYSNKKSIMKI